MDIASNPPNASPTNSRIAPQHTQSRLPNNIVMTPMIDNASANERRLPEFSLMPVEITTLGGERHSSPMIRIVLALGGGDNSLFP